MVNVDKRGRHEKAGDPLPGFQHVLLTAVLNRTAVPKSHFFNILDAFLAGFLLLKRNSKISSNVIKTNRCILNFKRYGA